MCERENKGMDTCVCVQAWGHLRQRPSAPCTGGAWGHRHTTNHSRSEYVLLPHLFTNPGLDVQAEFQHILPTWCKAAADASPAMPAPAMTTGGASQDTACAAALDTWPGALCLKHLQRRPAGKSQRGSGWCMPQRQMQFQGCKLTLLWSVGCTHTDIFRLIIHRHMHAHARTYKHTHSLSG